MRWLAVLVVALVLIEVFTEGAALKKKSKAVAKKPEAGKAVAGPKAGQKRRKRSVKPLARKLKKSKRSAKKPKSKQGKKRTRRAKKATKKH